MTEDAIKIKSTMYIISNLMLKYISLNRMETAEVSTLLQPNQKTTAVIQKYNTYDQTKFCNVWILVIDFPF